MDIRLLKYFLTVVEEGSITRAAQKLHMAQPPLSKQMKQLEEELGVVLFIRGKKNIQLTEAGVFLKNRGEEIISSLELAKRQLEEYKNGCKGHIIVGAVEAVAIHYLPEMIREFNQKYPNIIFEIWCGSTDDILNRLDRGIIDIGFLRNPFDEQKYEHFRLLSDSWGVLIPNDHPLAGIAGDMVTADMLKEEPLIVPSSANREEEIVEWFRQAGLQMTPHYKYNVLAIGEALVKRGMGLATVLADYRTVCSNDNIICKKLYPELKSAVNVVCSKNHFMTEVTYRFVEYLRDIAEE